MVEYSSGSGFFLSGLNASGAAVARPCLAPSLLAADFSRLGEEIARLENAGVQVLHLDIMDGHFVPNLSFGIPVVEAIRRSARLPLDVHLMLTQPGDYIRPFAQAGADSLTIHIEAVPNPIDLLNRIHDLGVGAGLAVSPQTDIRLVEPYLDYCDLVLNMSVMPGFGGQKFNESTLEKLSWLRDNAPARIWRSVDGGVNETTIARCTQAGATLLVMGTAMLGHSDYTQRYNMLHAAAVAGVAESEK